MWGARGQPLNQKVKTQKAKTEPHGRRTEASKPVLLVRHSLGDPLKYVGKLQKG